MQPTLLKVGQEVPRPKDDHKWLILDASGRPILVNDTGGRESIGGSSGGATGGVSTVGQDGANPTASVPIEVDPMSGDGSDGTAALLNWIDSASSSGGAEITLPAGEILLSAQIPITKPGITIKGKGRGATRLKIATAFEGNLIKWTNAFANRICDLTIDAQTQRTTGYAFENNGGNLDIPLKVGVYPLAANEVKIERVDLDRQHGGYLIQNVVGPPLKTPWITWVDEGRWFCSGGYGVDLNAVSGEGDLSFGASHFFNRLWIYQDQVAPPVTGGGLHIRGSGDANWTECEFFGLHQALTMDPPANGWITTQRFDRCFFDSSDISVAELAPDDDVAAFGDISFDGCWFASSGLHGLYLATEMARGVRANDCVFIANGLWGVVLADGCANNMFTHCAFVMNDPDGSGQGGFLATQNARDFLLTNSWFGSGGEYGIGFDFPQEIGVQVDDGCERYIVVNNNLFDNDTPFGDNGTTIAKIVTPNLT